MVGLNLDDTGERKFQHAASGYGVEVAGGTPDDRESSLLEQFGENTITVDCRENTSLDDIIEHVVVTVGHHEPYDINDVLLGAIDFRRAIEATDNNIAFLEFDALPDDAQTSLVQMMKGTAEHTGFEALIGYTVSERGSVAHAEPDLRGRIRTFTLDV